MKPGGFSIHQIGIDDHLSHYARRMTSKNYLRYSDRTWKRFFENDVQYINRLQMSDWIDIFTEEGFVLSERITESTDIAALQVHPQYRRYTGEDLACTILTIVLNKPTSSRPAER